MSANVAGSAALTPNSRLDIRRVTAPAIRNADRRPQTVIDMPCRTIIAITSGLCAPSAILHTDFMCPLGHGIGDDAIDPDRGQRQRERS